MNFIIHYFVAGTKWTKSTWYMIMINNQRGTKIWKKNLESIDTTRRKEITFSLARRQINKSINQWNTGIHWYIRTHSIHIHWKCTEFCLEMLLDCSTMIRELSLSFSVMMWWWWCWWRCYCRCCRALRRTHNRRRRRRWKSRQAKNSLSARKPTDPEMNRVQEEEK